MPTLDLARLDTVQLVPPTPFSDDGQTVNLDLLGQFTESVVSRGATVLLPAAGTGEFHSLSAGEVAGCVRAVRQAAPRVVVIAPVGYGVSHAVTIGRQAQADGADALLVMPPVHPYLSDAGFRDYFQTIAAAVDLPLLAYKKGPVPSDSLLTELGQGGRLMGVKYAVNDLDAFAKFVAVNRGRLGLYCGTAERFAPYFALAGATGYTSGLGNLAPRLTLALHAALRAGDFSAALRCLELVRPIEDFRAQAGDSYNITAIKAAMGIAGWNFGPVRPPQRRLTEEEFVRLRSLVETMLAAEAKQPPA